MTEWEHGPGIDRATAVIAVGFHVERERHEKATFQKEGHFVPGMKDENGFRREWDGPLVFVGTIWQDVRDVQGQVTGRNQVLRVLADSPAELDRLLQLAIKDSFFAWWSAQQLQTSTYESYRKHVDDHNEFVETYDGTFAMPENAASLSTVALADILLSAHKTRMLNAEGNLERCHEMLESCQERARELYDTLPWWSRKRHQEGQQK